MDGTGSTRLYATLGTGVDDPGDAVYAGISLGVARLRHVREWGGFVALSFGVIQ